MATAHRAVIQGFPQLMAALRLLPANLAAEADGIVTSIATDMRDKLLRAYPPKVVGEQQLGLREGVRLTFERSRFGIRAVLVSRSPVAHLWEFGTETRKTDEGWPRGEMPAHEDQGLVTLSDKGHRQMYRQFADLLREYGFTVTGI